MNARYLLAIPLCFAAMHGAGELSAQDDCKVIRVPATCQNGGRITINVNSKRIAPPNLCTTPGDSIDVSVRPEGAFVSLQSKSGDGWVSGNGDSFRLKVPGDADGNYDYAVFFEDGSCIDPRITVRR